MVQDMGAKIGRDQVSRFNRATTKADMKLYYDTDRARRILDEFELDEDTGIVMLAILVTFLPVRLLDCVRVKPDMRGSFMVGNTTYAMSYDPFSPAVRQGVSHDKDFSARKAGK